MLIIVGVLFGAVFIYKGFKAFLIKKYLEANQHPVVTVSTMKASKEPWAQQVSTVGSMQAVEGVSVTTELGGMIRNIDFQSGDYVEKDSILVELNTDTEVAQLASLEANLELAKVNFKRDKLQFLAQAVSQATLDTDTANLKSAEAQVQEQKATIQKKIVKAPFSGQLGIRQVDVGQYLNPGDTIVTLQSLDPIYVNFYLPQHFLTKIKKELEVALTIDAFPDKIFHGKITAFNPLVDTSTRNVEIQALIANPEHLLIPGMYATVNLTTEKPKDYITLPKTAISFNSYGALVYLIRQEENAKKDKPQLVAVQKFVKTGESRGDQISILEGVTEGDEVVTAGQLKLRNHSLVKINNSIQPSNNPAPNIVNE